MVKQESELQYCNNKNIINNLTFLIGMPRAGTTFLYHNLKKHPNIYVPFRRKTNYFSLHFNKKHKFLLEHFKHIQKDQIPIDTETLHFIDKNNKSCERIKELYPNAKAILIVRNPGDWVVSLYRQISTFDNKICSFENFLKSKYILEEDGKLLNFNYLDGDIEKKIEKLKNIFKNNLLIINFDLISNNPLQLLNTIEKFLSIKLFFRKDNILFKKINASNRCHNKFLSKLLRNRFLIYLLSKLPKSFVINIRSLYDILSSKNKHIDINLNNKELEIANKYSKSDNQYVKNIFKSSNILKF